MNQIQKPASIQRGREALSRFIEHYDREIIRELAASPEPRPLLEAFDDLLAVPSRHRFLDTIPPGVLPDPIRHRHHYPRYDQCQAERPERCRARTNRRVLRLPCRDHARSLAARGDQDGTVATRCSRQIPSGNAKPDSAW